MIFRANSLKMTSKLWPIKLTFKPSIIFKIQIKPSNLQKNNGYSTNIKQNYESITFNEDIRFLGLKEREGTTETKAESTILAPISKELRLRKITGCQLFSEVSREVENRRELQEDKRIASAIEERENSKNNFMQLSGI